MKRDQFVPYWHFHPEIELTFIKKGKGVRIVGDSILPFTDGDLVLLGSNLPHNWISFENNEYCEAFVLQFSPQLVNNSAELAELALLIKRAKSGLLFIHPPPKILEVFHKFGDLPDALKVARLIEMLYELNQLDDVESLTSSSYRIPSYNYKSQQRYEKVADYVISNIHKKITLQEIADIANMSRESFSRWFKQASGSSFIHYLNRTKVEVACHLLIHSEDNVNEVGYKVGFDSQSQFHRSFKNYKAISPLKFRKQHLG